jgi:Subtilase family
MQHPEFNGRLRPGITQGQTKDDWDIDWLFPKVDVDEFFKMSDDIEQKYEYSYIDPNSPNFNGGIHPAYSDLRLRETGDGWGDLTPHGTRVSAFIMGDTLGQAQNCRYTMVKLPQYTNGPRSRKGVSFPLFAAMNALILIQQDIQQRKDQGEKFFIISSSLGHLFRSNDRSNEERFESCWNDFLNWVNENGITIVASAGNSRQRNPSIDLVPARLFRDPQIVVGSVTPDAMAHPKSQGNIGDGILTAYAPSAGALMVSSDPNGVYTYQWLNTAGSAVTSFGTY